MNLPLNSSTNLKLTEIAFCASVKTSFSFYNLHVLEQILTQYQRGLCKRKRSDLTEIQQEDVENVFKLYLITCYYLTLIV